MPLARTANQETIGDKLYFFRSPRPGETTCTIIAHGGKLHGDTTFTLPANVSVSFFVPDSQALQTNMLFNVKYAGDDAMMRPLPPITGPGNCPDYSLAKFAGKHNTAKSSYVDMNRYMQERLNQSPHTCPHLVSIRSRSLFKGYSKIVKLSEVITAVLGHEPSINLFYVAACRGHHLSYRTLLHARVFGG